MSTQSVIHPVQRSHSRKALTPEEILKVLKIGSESKRNLAMILLAYRHGMRASEVCDLRLSDLDLKNGEVTIRRLKGSLRTVQPLCDHPGQPLLSEKRVLRAWLAERRDASDFVFALRRAEKFIAPNSSVCSNPLPNGRGCHRTGGIRTASNMLSALPSLRATSTWPS
jgi:integrase